MESIGPRELGADLRGGIVSPGFKIASWIPMLRSRSIRTSPQRPTTTDALHSVRSSRRRRQKNANNQEQARCEYQQECIIDNRHEAILCEIPQRVKPELCNRWLFRSVHVLKSPT